MARDPMFDLIILDVIMPRMSGPEILDLIRAVHPEAKALYISGYAADALNAKGLLTNATGFLAKPMSPVNCCSRSGPSWTELPGVPGFLPWAGGAGSTSDESNMKVLLVQPPSGDPLSDHLFLFEPLGLEYSGAGLQLDGHVAEILDARLTPDLESACRRFQPQVVGLTGNIRQFNIIKNVGEAGSIVIS